MFFCRGCYITDLRLSDTELTLKIKASQDYRPDEQIKIHIQQNRGSELALIWDHSQALTRPFLIKGWDKDFPANWIINIEDALAFCGPVPLAQMTVAS